MIRSAISTIFFAGCLVAWAAAHEPDAVRKSAALQAFVDSHCLECHDKTSRKGGLPLDELSAKDVSASSEAWEKVVRKLSARQMPPPKSARPAEREYAEAIAALTTSLDAAAAKTPNPGRTETFRRLNRTEYRNAIRDLLALDVDIAALLPADESSHGFDNVTVTDLSPTLLNRYVTAAQKISRLAVGIAPASPRGETIRVRPDITQDVHLEGLPIGTRGGVLVQHNFPASGEYEIQIHLMRDRNEGIEGLSGQHDLEISLDRERVELFKIKPPGKGESEQDVDANLKTRIKVDAGPHKLAAAFVKKPSSLLETTRQPLNVHFNYYRHPRIGPAVYEVSIVGPFEPQPASDTPSRRKIFIGEPQGLSASAELECAKKILANLARRAYRRPVDDEDLRSLLTFFEQGRAGGSFETGIEAALAALLVKPQFLFRIEHEPAEVPASGVYRISDLELASRLSFFLWSSLPDEELLAIAERNELHHPPALDAQVRRMLADPRAESLVTNFASQWLYLRNLDSVTPDMRLFPDFDDNLRQSLRKETELNFAELLREDQSVLKLLQSDHTWLNERLAKHYGIPHIHGSRFRRVDLADDTHRGGLLRQGSILTVTSYATRTSPVIRGHWVLQNLIGAAPPPPPPDVPALDEVISSTLSIRERLQQHRANAACASCHQQMDPLGFSLENFDAIGRFRQTEAGRAIDATGGFVADNEFTGAAGLEKVLLERPELFIRTLTEKLLTFALGRGVEHYDAPAVRQIVRDARADGDRFSRVVLGIVQSAPFQMRKNP